MIRLRSRTPESGKPSTRFCIGRGFRNRLNIVLEVGGWATILAYVRDRFGVGVVSEGAVNETKGLIIRRLDPEVFPRIESRLICRRLASSVNELDLSLQGHAWREVLLRVAVAPSPAPRAPAPRRGEGGTTFSFLLLPFFLFSPF